MDLPTARPLFASAFAFICVVAACSEPRVEIPLELRPEDLAVVVSVIDGRAQVSLHRAEPGEPVAIPSDAGRSLYSFVLRPEDFVRPEGTPVGAEGLRGVSARLERDEAPAGQGACGRCLVLARGAPQLVNPGDSCTPARFLPQAVWLPGDGGYGCRAAPGNPACARAASEAELAELEEIRRAVRIEWPGACACTPEEGPSSGNLELTSVSPEVAPWPLQVFAQREDGLLAGFSRHTTMLHDPARGTTELTPLGGFDHILRAAGVLPSGDFLLASEVFSGVGDRYVFHRFPVENGRLGAPIVLQRDSAALPGRIRHLGGDPNLPLYLIGTTRNLSHYEPAIFACNEGLACQRVMVGSCGRAVPFVRMHDIDVLPDGTGIGFATGGLYYKPPNAPPLVNPHPSDPWSCWLPEATIPWASGEAAPVKIASFGSMTRRGDRVFLCAVADTERCQPDYPVVLTATVGAAPGELPNPAWRVTHRGPNGARCRDFFDVPNEPERVRLLLSNGRFIDLDAAGQPTEERWVADVHGPVPGFLNLLQLAPGWVTALARENRVYAAESGGRLAPIYGAEQVASATYRAAVALPDGNFLAFGHPLGVMRVQVGAARATLLEPPAEGWPADLVIHAAALDTGASELASNGARVVLLGGSRGNAGFLGRLVVEGARSPSLTPLELPETAASFVVTALTEVARGTFVGVTQGSHIFRLVGDQTRAVELTWDDPETEALESQPTASPHTCTGVVPRLDLWRALDGVHGIAYAVGDRGAVMRVVGERAERLAVPPEVDLTAVRAACGDRVLLAGRARQVDLAGLERVRLQLLQLEADGGSGRLAFAGIPESDLQSNGLYDFYAGNPRALLADPGSLAGPRFGVTAVLESGFVWRPLAREPVPFVRAPFEPLALARAPSGAVLFAGGEARLVLGVPR